MSSPRNAAELQRTGRTDQTETEHDAQKAPSGPSFLERQRAARPWLDHLVRAGLRYTQQKGDYYAAGITYFSVLALVPLIMISFAAAGFVLAGDGALLDRVKSEVAAAVPGNAAATISDLIDSAIMARTSVGLIGLALALYAGLGWITNIREALTAQWDKRHEPGPFLRTKLADLCALIGLGLALVVSFGLSGVAGAGTSALLGLLGLDQVPGSFLLTATLALLLSIATTWAVFAWVIARLPREPVSGRSAVRAGLLAAVVFEGFKQLGVLYLQAVTGGPAGSTFGPVIGILVFIYTTARFLLFATAWAATAPENLAASVSGGVVVGRCPDPPAPAAHPGR